MRAAQDSSIGEPRWRVILEVVLGTVALVATAAAVFEATVTRSQLDEQIAVEAGSIDQQLLAAIRDVDRLFIGKPWLRPYFYADRPEPADRSDLRVVRATAELLLDTLDGAASARRHGLLSDEDWDDWKAAGHSYYRGSPALRGAWERLRRFYSPETGQMLRPG
jgi:hypothetical protein